VPLLPYQQAWISDDAQLKIVVKGRQLGFSFAAALRAVLKCLERRTTWIFLSKGERQSRELMEKVKDHCLMLKELRRLEGFEEVPLPEMKAMEINFPNRSKIVGLPANPDTARGYSGNVTLDEFAFHADAGKIYTAIYPSITRGYSLELISTPNGQQGKFFEVAKAAGLVPGYARDAQSRWSAHKVSVHDAVAQGLQIDLEMLRAGVDDDETWQQEYECAFLSDAQNYIPMEMLWACTSEAATAGFEISDLKGRELYLGVDIGRKRDLTVAWMFEKLGDVLWSRLLLAMKNTNFDTQEQTIGDLLALQPRRCCIDQSGLGMMLAERLQRKFGAVVEPVQFTAQVKERLAPAVKRAFEDRTIRIPDDRDVRADINAVKRFVTPAGNLRFDADRTDRGHADRFWAMALAIEAAAQTPSSLSLQGFMCGTPRDAELSLTQIET